jgi:hypothetical protein
MADIERWTITLSGRRIGHEHGDYSWTLTTVEPRPPEGGEPFEVVRASTYQRAVEALEDATEYLRLASTWIEDTDRHNKMKRAHERVQGALNHLEGR